MTATPHAGREEDFQLFMALLDTDRFEGRYRDAVHTVNTDGLMRRMVKEDLKTFEGKPLFPERRAYTVAYELSEDEKDPLRRGHRVRPRRDEPRRPAAATQGDKQARLHRRLRPHGPAAAPGLQPRGDPQVARTTPQAPGEAPQRDALRQQLAPRTTTSPRRLRDLLGKDPTEADLTDAGHGRRRPAERARPRRSSPRSPTPPPRRARSPNSTRNSRILADLIELARRVRHSGTDKKWTELRELLTDNTMITGEKIIIFTEHRDTLEYLAERIRDLLGRSDAVVTIHGGVRREERRKIKELFTQDIDTRVLVATDAAGEGLNLQRAHLMVNYDLPWNPNRIEQRFGRIHRIGQTEVCHLWNLVADRHPRGHGLRPAARQDRGAAQGLPRQGLRRARRGLRGQAAAGPADRGDPLRQPTPRSAPGSTRSSTRPSARAWTSSSPSAPRTPTSSPSRTWRSGAPGWTRRTPAACSRTTSARSSSSAFKLLGGRMSEREAGRYEIRHVPADIRDRDRQIGTSAAPVLAKYERVTFDKELTRPEGKPRADLLAPGHPLLDAVTDLIIERYGTLLKQGTMLADRHDPGTEPRLLVAVTHEITDGHDPARTITKKFGFVGGGCARPARGARPPARRGTWTTSP